MVLLPYDKYQDLLRSKADLEPSSNTSDKLLNPSQQLNKYKIADVEEKNIEETDKSDKTVFPVSDEQPIEKKKHENVSSNIKTTFQGKKGPPGRRNWTYHWKKIYK